MKVKILDQTHPDFDEAELQKLDALHRGGKAWGKLKDIWLPQLAREHQDTWEERKKLAGYVNHAGPIVSLLAALLFSEDSQVEGLPDNDTYWSRFFSNVDRQGTPWTRFWTELLESAEVGQRAFAWVNMPRREGEEPVSLAEQDAKGLRDAFLVGLSARQVRNWGIDDRGLAWIMVKGVEETQAGPEAERVRQIRWTAITRTEIMQWVWTATDDTPQPGPDADAQEDVRVKHQQPGIPVVMLELPPGLHTMGKLKDAAIKAATARNDLDWALHQAANELLVIKTKADGDVILGHGAYLGLQPDDDAKFIGPSGVAFEHLAAAAEAHREDIYRLVHQMALSADASASSQARSGESKQMDWQALQIILASYQDRVLGAMRQVLQVVARYRGESTIADQVTVSGLEGWKTEDLGRWLELVLLAMDASKMSSTYRREVAKVQARRLLSDHVSPEVMETIEQEIEAAQDDPLADFRPGGGTQE